MKIEAAFSSERITWNKAHFFNSVKRNKSPEDKLYQMTHKHMKTTHGIGENIYKSHI
jgi:ribosomal protein L1